MKYKISAEQYAEIKAAQKRNRDKQIENRLKVLALRYEGKRLDEIAEATGFHHAHISNLIRKYFEEGLSAVSEKHYAGNRRNMSIEEESAFLEQYRQSGEAGHILDVREMKMAYEERVGHSIGSSQIYRVLERHSWRKVMPRSKHPKKASEEVILTCSSTHLTSDPDRVMLLTWQQPDSTATALNKFCSICTPYGVYTEFGIDPAHAGVKRAFARRSPVITSGNTDMSTVQSSQPLERAVFWLCLTAILFA